MKTIVLLQPKYPHGGSQVYLPGSLMNLGSRLMAIGCRVEFFDLNLSVLASAEVLNKILDCDAVGITVLGSPYIPVALQIVKDLRAMGYQGRILIGGEGIVRVEPERFARTFRDTGDVRQVREDGDILRALGIELRRLPSMFETSMVPMLRRLAPHQLLRYLRHEFCIFLSYGCAYNCHYCSAAKGMKETYHSMDALREEMNFICTFLAKAGYSVASVYVSNLDIMQTVDAFERAMEIINETSRKHRVRINVRGLATTHFLCRAISRDAAVLRRLRNYGLCAIGFGVDGADARVWQRENKGHNRLAEADQAIRATREAGITPEVLMVTGFPGDDPKALLATIRYSIACRRRGAVIRPYLGKHGTPGSKSWIEHKGLAETYIKQPELFRRLDYAMFGSETTHPDLIQRWMANMAYTALILLGLDGDHATYPLIPVPVQSGMRRLIAMALNRLMPFDH